MPHIRLQKTVKIKPTKPFVFDPTFHKPGHFTSGDNLWKPGILWQTWNWRGKRLGIKFSNIDDYFSQGLLYEAVNYVWEDIWWKRKSQHIPWLEKEIRI